MASKAREIVSINRANKTADVKRYDGGSYPIEFWKLDRNTLIKVCKMLGHSFVGRTPLSYTQYELKKIADGICDGNPVVPDVPAVVSTPIQVGISGRVEKAVADVIADALRGLTPASGSNVDEAQVVTMVNQAVGNAITVHVAETQKSIDALTRVVHESMPTVTQITLSGGDIKTITDRTHHMFPQVMKVIDAGMNAWLTGGAGVGKTTIAEQVAKALDLEYSPESFCGQSSKSEMKGYKDGHGLYQSTEFRQRFEGGGVYLLDEVDGANPNILLALNSALSNGIMGFPDKTVRKHPKFIAIACANTYGNGATAEYVGRQVIDGSTTDRFVKLDIPIDEDMESGIVNDISVDNYAGRQWVGFVRQARTNVTSYGLKVIISPRASIHGAKLLNAGFTFQQCVPMTFGSGVKPETLAKVMQGITIPSGGAVLAK